MVPRTPGGPGLALVTSQPNETPLRAARSSAPSVGRLRSGVDGVECDPPGVDVAGHARLPPPLQKMAGEEGFEPSSS